MFRVLQVIIYFFAFIFYINEKNLIPVAHLI